MVIRLRARSATAVFLRLLRIMEVQTDAADHNVRHDVLDFASFQLASWD